MSNSDALAEFVGGLPGGSLSPEVRVLAEAAGSLAVLVDEGGGDRLWREYRLALAALFEAALGSNDIDDELSEALEAMRSAEVRDGEDSGP